jgi:hypothetical protein
METKQVRQVKTSGTIVITPKVLKVITPNVK